ncbi:hypothetical protein [Streptomyces sp. NPDC007369]|uniref:hypothetical protein n=1 Tax=Streptomyces sp. NPDC007369 TaxID=3154589 RepID=UPI0033E1A28C
MPTGTSPAHEGAALERRVLGHGIALGPVGAGSIGHDLVFTSRQGGRDLALVEGTANLAQCLSVALLTAPGTDPFHVGFGFDGLRVLTQGLTPPMALELLRLSVLRTLAADARVAEVVELTLAETAPGSRRWQATAVLRTVVGSALHTVIGEVTADA